MKKQKRTAKAAAVVTSKTNVNPEVKDTSPYVAQREKIDFTLSVRELPWTDKQKEIINLVKELSNNYTQIISRDEIKKYPIINWGNNGIGDRFARK